MDVAARYRATRELIEQICLDCGRQPSEVTLVAVSKSHPLEHCLPAYHAGCRDFGENRVPEALEKVDTGPEDLRWHFIGTLQSKKVSKVIGKFCLLHSIDTLELAKKVAQASVREGVVSAVLLQVNASGEESKHGWSPEQIEADMVALQDLEGLDIQGLMTMAPYTDDEEQLRSSFRRLRELRDRFGLRELSMGMSNDFRIAIEEGATLVRIGTAIFGPR